MMALMLRTTIYLFDVRLLMLFVDRVVRICFLSVGAGYPPKLLRLDRAIPLRKFCVKFSLPLTCPQAETCEVLYTTVTSVNGNNVMPDDEKQVLEGIRRNVIEMNRRLKDISKFVGV